MFRIVLLLLLFAALAFMMINDQQQYAGEGDDGRPKPASTIGTQPETTEQAMFGAGCFWGVEAAFRALEGVTQTAVGFSGGHTENPSYRDVCGGFTGHAEVVHVTYDPTQISYEKLLNRFWEIHNPTQVNRQGPDHGSQYRTAIFYYTDEQKRMAEASKAALAKSGKYDKPIATEITKAAPFYAAEEYHQRYVEKNPGYRCHF